MHAKITCKRPVDVKMASSLFFDPFLDYLIEYCAVSSECILRNSEDIKTAGRKTAEKVVRKIILIPIIKEIYIHLSRSSGQV